MQASQSRQLNDRIKVIDRAPAPKRLHVKVYHDFLKCGLLSSDEKLLFIVMKSFLNFDDEKDGRADGRIYPSQATMAAILGWSRQKVGRVIASLEGKRIITTAHRAKNKTDIYTIADYKEIWTAGSIEEMQEAAELPAGARAARRLTDEELVEEMRRRGLMLNDTNEDGKEKGSRGRTPESQKIMHISNAPSYEDNITQRVALQDQNTDSVVNNGISEPTTEKIGVYDHTTQPTTPAAENGLQGLVNAAVAGMKAAKESPDTWTGQDTDEAIRRFRAAKDVKSARAYMAEICRDIMLSKQASGARMDRGTRRPPAGNFANFEQREYNPQELERLERALLQVTFEEDAKMLDAMPPAARRK